MANYETMTSGDSLQDYQGDDKERAIITDPGTSPQEREEALCRLIDAMVEESDAGQDSLNERHIKAIRYWRGRQWMDREPNKKNGKSFKEAVSNRIYPTIEQKIAMMTQNNPKATFLPQSYDDYRYVKDLETLTKRVAQKRKIRSRLIEFEHASMIFGYKAVHVYWDDRMPGRADVNFRLLMPGELLIDPQLRNTNLEDGQYVGVRRTVDLDYIKNRWPEQAARIEEEFETQDSSEYSTEIDENSLDEELGWHNDRIGGYETSSKSERERKEADLISIWYRDYTTQKVQTPVPFEVLIQNKVIVEHPVTKNYVYPESGELWSLDNTPRTEIDVPAYPQGRFTIKVGKIILEDRAWSGDWPIALGNNAIIPFRWFGMDETEQLQAVQDQLNNLSSHMQEHTDACLHPKRKVLYEAIRNKSDLKSIGYEPDQTIFLNTTNAGINGIAWEAPPPLSPDTYNLYERGISDIENASGLSGV